MSRRDKVFIRAAIDRELVPAWLQHVRDFDTAHPGCQFEIGIDSVPHMTVTDMVEQMRVEPALTFTKIFARGSK